VALLWSASRIAAPFVDQGASMEVDIGTAGAGDDDIDGMVVVREAALAALSALVVTMVYGWVR
jgi:hypothetical protein